MSDQELDIDEIDRGEPRQSHVPVADGEETERFIKVNVRDPEVLVRDDTASLSQIEETTQRVLRQAKETHKELAQAEKDGEGGVMHR